MRETATKTKHCFLEEVFWVNLTLSSKSNEEHVVDFFGRNVCMTQNINPVSTLVTANLQDTLQRKLLCDEFDLEENIPFDLISGMSPLNELKPIPMQSVLSKKLREQIRVLMTMIVRFLNRTRHGHDTIRKS